MESKAKLIIQKSINIEKFFLVGFLILLALLMPDIFVKIVIPSLLFIIFILPDLVMLYWDKIRLEISAQNILYIIYNRQVIFTCELDIIESIWIENSSVNYLPTSSALFVYLKEEDALLGSQCLMLSLSSIFSINKIRKIEAYTITNFLKEYNDKIRFTIY